MDLAFWTIVTKTSPTYHITYNYTAKTIIYKDEIYSCSIAIKDKTFACEFEKSISNMIHLRDGALFSSLISKIDANISDDHNAALKLWLHLS